MKKSRVLGTVCAAVFSFISMPSHAALVDNGGGLIYDTVLDITWAQPPDTRMNWIDASTWAAGLRLGGVSGWRLPYISVAEGAGPFLGSPVDCNTATEVACRDNELGYMFDYNLGGTYAQSVLTSGDPDLALFPTLQSNAYWSGTRYRSDSAWIFFFSSGGQRWDAGRPPNFYAWAVHAGDVSPVALSANAETRNYKVLVYGHYTNDVEAGGEEWTFEVEATPIFESAPMGVKKDLVTTHNGDSDPNFLSFRNTSDKIILDETYTDRFPKHIYLFQWGWENDRGGRTVYDCCSWWKNDDDSYGPGAAYAYVDGLPDGTYHFTHPSLQGGSGRKHGISFEVTITTINSDKTPPQELPDPGSIPGFYERHDGDFWREHDKKFMIPSD